METRDRVVETSTTIGAGDFTLLGSPTGYLPFSPEFALSVPFEYLIETETSVQWEIGVGHLSNATTLVRDLVERSTNSNTFVNFGSGVKTVSNILTATQLATFITDAAAYQTEIDFGAIPIYEAEFTIANANVLLSHRITGGIAYEAPTGKDLDEVTMDVIDLKFGQVVGGSFKIYARGTEGYLHDKFKVNYFLGN